MNDRETKEAGADVQKGSTQEVVEVDVLKGMSDRIIYALEIVMIHKDGVNVEEFSLQINDEEVICENSVKALLHVAFFLATCNSILLLGHVN